MNKTIKHLLVAVATSCLVWYFSKIIFNNYLPPASNGCLPPITCDFVDNRASMYSAITGIVSFALVLAGFWLRARKQK